MSDPAIKSRTEDEDGWRWYEGVDGRKYISVTQVLDVATHQRLTNWYKNNSAKKIEKVKLVTADLGTRIHKAVENDLKGVEQKIEPDVAPAFKEWLKLKAEHKIEAKVTERTLYSQVFGFAGTADIVGLFDGKLCVMDIKTGTYSIKTGWQLAGYKTCWEEATKDMNVGMVGISIHRDGRIGQPFVYEHYDFCFERFLACLEAWKGLYFNKLAKMNWPWLKRNAFKAYYNVINLCLDCQVVNVGEGQELCEDCIRGLK